MATWLWEAFLGYLAFNAVLAGSGGLVCLTAWILIQLNGGEW